MKNSIIALCLLSLLTFSCKKERKAAPVPTPVSISDTTKHSQPYFEGKWIIYDTTRTEDWTKAAYSYTILYHFKEIILHNDSTLSVLTPFASLPGTWNLQNNNFMLQLSNSSNKESFSLQIIDSYHMTLTTQEVEIDDAFQNISFRGIVTYYLQRQP